MSIKSLLLGSAAALVAVSGARAADAIVAEPEPVEYVRVCDAYGAGFYYIPGTNTCLRIGGEVRAQVGGSRYAYPGVRTTTTTVIDSTGPTTLGSITTTNAVAAAAAPLMVPTTYSALVRARIFFDARSDTELGTLRSYVRIDANRGHGPLVGAAAQVNTIDVGVVPPTSTITGGTGFNSAGVDGVVLNHAYIELGGFKIGWTDSTWATFAGFGSHSDTGLGYGYQQRGLASYTFSGNGFSAIIAVEGDGNANYVPDVVGGVAYSGGWGRAFAQVGYDESAIGWGLAGGVTINVPNAPGSSLIVKGYYASNAGVAYSPGSQWSFLASYGHQFNSQLFASVGAQYRGNLASVRGVVGAPDTAGAGGAFLPDDDLTLELNVVYTPVENFAIRGELAYNTAWGPNVVAATRSNWAGFIRFTRSF